MSLDEDSPLFSDLDIETLHSQLLEAAASVDSAVQPPADVWKHGFLSGDIHDFDYGNSIITPETTDHTIKNAVGESMNSPARFTFRTDTSIWMRLDNRAIRERASYDGDVDFAYVRPQAVEYNPVVPADYTTAIPSIYMHQRTSPNPRTPPLRVVDGNVAGVERTRKPKAQAFHLHPAKNAKRAASTSATPTTFKDRTSVSARDIGEFCAQKKAVGRCARGLET